MLRVKYQALLPRPSQSGLPEPFEQYLKRVATLLPRFPESVLQDWLYRHHESAFEVYDWLDYETFSFREEAWPTDRIIQDVQTTRKDLIEAWRDFIDPHAPMKLPLIEYMLDYGTWPVSPVVLDNVSGIQSPSGEALFRYHLLEGHHRLAYLHGLAKWNHKKISSSHKLWLVTIEHGN